MNHPLLPYLLTRIRREHQVDLSSDPLALEHLSQVADTMWPRLQQQETVTIHLPDFLHQRGQRSDLHLVVTPEELEVIPVFSGAAEARLERVLGYTWGHLLPRIGLTVLLCLILAAVIGKQVIPSREQFAPMMGVVVLVLVSNCLMYTWSVRRIWVYPEHLLLRSLLTQRTTHIMAAEISDFYSIYSKNSLTYYLLLHSGKKIAVADRYRGIGISSFPKQDLDVLDAWLRRHRIAIEYEINRVNFLRFRP